MEIETYISDTDFETRIASIAANIEQGYATKAEVNLKADAGKVDEALKDKADRKELDKFLTNEQLTDYATKDDLKTYATTDSLKAYATKDDLKTYATTDSLKTNIDNVKDIIQQLDNHVGDVYATIEYVDSKITGGGGSGGSQDSGSDESETQSGDFITTEAADAKYQTKADMENYLKRDDQIITTFTTQSDIDDSVNPVWESVNTITATYTSKAYVDGKIKTVQTSIDAKADQADLDNCLKTGALNGYATEDYVNQKLGEIGQSEIDLSPYLTTEDAEKQYVQKNDLSPYLKTADLESNLEDYAKETTLDSVKTQLENAIGSLETEMANKAVKDEIKGFATTSYVDNKITESDTNFLVSLNDFKTTAANTYATKDALKNIPSIDSLQLYAKTEDLEAYAKNEQLSVYATKEQLSAYAKEAELSVYAKKTELSAYAKKEDVHDYKFEALNGCVQILTDGDTVKIGVYYI